MIEAIEVRKLKDERAVLLDKLACVCALIWEHDTGRAGSLSRERVELLIRVTNDEEIIAAADDYLFFPPRKARNGNHLPNLGIIREKLDFEND